MDNNSKFLVVLGFLVFLGILNITIMIGQKDSIRSYLRKQGAKNILVSWEPLDFDKSNNTFYVEFVDAQGTIRKRRCKIHRFGSNIYWEDEQQLEDQ